jgi:hypothetical protein
VEVSRKVFDVDVVSADVVVDRLRREDDDEGQVVSTALSTGLTQRKAAAKPRDFCSVEASIHTVDMNENLILLGKSNFSGVFCSETVGVRPSLCALSRLEGSKKK